MNHHARLEKWDKFSKICIKIIKDIRNTKYKIFNRILKMHFYGKFETNKNTESGSNEAKTSIFMHKLVGFLVFSK